MPPFNQYFFSRFRDEVIACLDSIDTRVEALRKEALMLEEERDNILTRIDMLKNTDLLAHLSQTDHEDVDLQLKRISGRLQVRFVNMLSRFVVIQSCLAFADCRSQCPHCSR